MSTDIFGYIGASLIVISLTPQIVKTYNTKNTNDISLKFIFMQILTVIFLLIYTSLKGDLPLMIANICLIFQFSVLLYFKCTYRNKENSIEDNIVDKCNMRVTSV